LSDRSDRRRNGTVEYFAKMPMNTHSTLDSYTGELAVNSS